jgi:hypothetical protein
VSDLARMRYNGLAANRAHDVLHYLRLVESTGDPSPRLIAKVEGAIATIKQGKQEGSGPRRFEQVTYEAVAKQMGWHRGGPGDHLAKALAVVSKEAAG